MPEIAQRKKDQDLEIIGEENIRVHLSQNHIADLDQDLNKKKGIKEVVPAVLKAEAKIRKTINQKKIKNQKDHQAARAKVEAAPNQIDEMNFSFI